MSIDFKPGTTLQPTQQLCHSAGLASEDTPFLTAKIEWNSDIELRL